MGLPVILWSKSGFRDEAGSTQKAKTAIRGLATFLLREHR